jgi:hypothetical protein
MFTNDMAEEEINDASSAISRLRIQQAKGVRSCLPFLANLFLHMDYPL